MELASLVTARRVLHGGEEILDEHIGGASRLADRGRMAVHAARATATVTARTPRRLSFGRPRPARAEAAPGSGWSSSASAASP